MSKKESLKEKKARKGLVEDSASAGSEEESEGDSKPERQINEDGEEYWALTKSKRLSVGKFKGSVNINLREYFEKDDKWLPTKKGITLNMDSWNLLKKIVKDVDEAIAKKQKEK
jgi:hypothetical protein